MRITPLIFDITVGIYTLALLAAIQYYEHKLDTLIRSNLKLKYSKNGSHYAWLQLELNKRTEENNALQIQNKALKGEIAALRNVGESRNMQYESSSYKSSTWEGNYANETMLEEEPFGLTPYLDFHQDELDLEQ
jgi:hypothetical protein